MRRAACVVVTAGLAVVAAATAWAPAATAGTFAGGNGLVAYSQFVDGTPGAQIWTTDPATGRTVDISRRTYGDDQPDFSPSGSTVLFRHDGDLWTMSPTGGGRHRLTSGSHGSYGEASWSSDGKRIVFDDNGDIAVANADGTGLTLITSDGDNDLPTWSPDGATIAFTSYHDAGDTQHVFTMKPDGSAVTDVSHRTDPTDGYSDSDPSWSPDSTHIVFDTTRGTGGTQVYEMTRNGSRAVDLRAGFSDGSGSVHGGVGPVLSPDGTSFAYTANDEGNLQIFVQTIGATGGRPITDSSDTSLGDDVSWQATVTVGVSASPRSGPGGTSVALTLSGYGDGEVIALTFTDSAGTRTRLGSVTASATGTATKDVEIPATAPAGTGSLAGVGRETGRSAAASYTVT